MDPLPRQRSRGGRKLSKQLRAATFRKVGFFKPDTKKLLALVKERWAQTKELLDPAPPVEYDDSGRHILLTAAHFKYLESVKFAIEALVDDCKKTLAHESTDSARPFSHDDGSIMVQECESYSAQPCQHDDEATSEEEGESYSAQPTRPSQQQLVLEAASSSSIAPAFQVEANILRATDPDLQIALTNAAS